MAIQITNDPINQFLDNLPKYALELRRQDAQARQFDRQMDLKEKADERQQTLFDLTRNRQKFVSDVTREQWNYQTKFRNAKRDWNEWKLKNERQLDSWKTRRKYLPDGIAGRTYEDNLEIRRNNAKGILWAAEKIGADTSNLRSRLADIDKQIADYKSLPNFSKITPKEVSIPENLEFDQSLLGFATQHNLQPTIQDEIQKYFTMLGGDQMGIQDPMFEIQQIETQGMR